MEKSYLKYLNLLLLSKYNAFYSLNNKHVTSDNGYETGSVSRLVGISFKNIRSGSGWHGRGSKMKSSNLVNLEGNIIMDF